MSAEGIFSWGTTSTSPKIHEACIRKIETNDIIESIFAGLTQQM